MGSRFIDLNADGVTDVVENGVISPTDVRRSIHKHRNNLAKTPKYISPVEIIHTGLPMGSDLGVRYLDLNGDGQTDFVQSSRLTPTDTRIGAWINTGTGWKRSTSYTPPVQITSPAGVILDMGVRIVDLDGNGLPDLIQSVWASNADQRTSAWLNAAKKLPDYLTSITNGMGAKTTLRNQAKKFKSHKRNNAKWTSKYVAPKHQATQKQNQETAHNNLHTGAKSVTIGQHTIRDSHTNTKQDQT